MLVLDKNGITEYLGNYDYYVEHIRTEQTEAKAEVAVKKEKPQNDYFLQKQRQSEERKNRQDLKKRKRQLKDLMKK